MVKSVFLLVALMVAGGSSALLPAAYVANYASSYNAHVVNHAIAAPVASYVAPAAPIVAAHPAPLVAPAAPLVAPASPLVASACVPRAAPVVAAAPLQAYSIHPY